jgi:hypothetical protein
MRSTRSSQEPPPDWSNLDHNTIPQLRQILRSLGVDAAANASRWDLTRAIRDLQTPNKVPYKALTPQPRHVPTPPLFSDDDDDAPIPSADHPPWSAPTRSRLFPGSDRVAPPRSPRLTSPGPPPSRAIHVAGFVILALLAAAFIVLVRRFRSFPRQALTPEDEAAKYLHRLAGRCSLPEHRAREEVLEELFPGLDVAALAAAAGIRAADGWMWSEAPDWGMFCDPNVMHKQVVVGAILFVVLMMVLVVFWCCR